MVGIERGETIHACSSHSTDSMCVGCVWGGEGGGEGVLVRGMGALRRVGRLTGKVFCSIESVYECVGVCVCVRARVCTGAGLGALRWVRRFMGKALNS